MTTPTNTRVGIIGAGFIGDVHARAARAAGAEIAAVASAKLASAERLAAHHGARSVSTDQLLDDPSIDVVHICSPNGTHAEYAARAIERGKHVVCEKPLTTDVGSADALARRARDARVIAVVPFAYRYNPMAHEVRARVERGDAGRLVSFTGSYLQDWRLAYGGSGWWTDPQLSGASRAFADIGSHVGDLLEFMTGTRIRRVSAVTRRVEAETTDGVPVETEDLAAALVELEGGAIGTISVSQMSLGSKNELTVQVSGSEASYRFAEETPDTIWVGGAEYSSIVPRQASSLTAAAAALSVVPAGHPMGYQDAFNGLVADTYRAVAGVATVGELPTFDDGARMVRLTDAVLRSARTGLWVDVEEGASA